MRKREGSQSGEGPRQAWQGAQISPALAMVSEPFLPAVTPSHFRPNWLLCPHTLPSSHEYTVAVVIAASRSPCLHPTRPNQDLVRPSRSLASWELASMVGPATTCLPQSPHPSLCLHHVYPPQVTQQGLVGSPPSRLRKLSVAWLVSPYSVTVGHLDLCLPYLAY
jgi:hypothetical protein